MSEVSTETVTTNEESNVVSNDTPATETVAKPKRARKPKVKRGRGRPAVFTGNTKRHIVAVIRKHGLTGGRVVLAEEGTNISLPTLGKFAAEAGIELHRGRPSKAA